MNDQLNRKLLNSIGMVPIMESENLQTSFSSRKSWIFVLIFISSLSAFSQSDTLFWFAAPEVIQQRNNWDRPIVFRISSYGDAANVQISQPANANFPDTTFTIDPNSLATIDLTEWIDQVENKPADSVLNYGIRISSSSPVSIYYEVVSSTCDCAPEMFTLKGESALGNKFWVSGQTFVNNNNRFSTNNESFVIVSTEDETVVQITPAHDVMGHPALVPFTVTLNRGNTFTVMAATHLAEQGLAGTEIVASKPIAVTLINDALRSSDFGTCTDAAGDQLIPSSSIGTEYIAINGFLDGVGDQLFILSISDSTIISRDGTQIDTLSKGETMQIDVGDSSTYISSSDSIYVTQLSGFGCELGLAQLPQIICTGSNSLTLARSTEEPFFLNLLIPTGGERDFLVNGVSGIIQSENFKEVPGTSGQWLAGQTELNTVIFPADSIVRISNAVQPFHLSVIHGGAGTGTRFGYFSNFTCPSSIASIDRNLKIKISLFPNPAPGTFSLRSPQVVIQSLALYDLTGRRLPAEISHDRHEAQVHSSYRGLVLVKVQTDQGRWVQKVLLE